MDQDVSACLGADLLSQLAAIVGPDGILSGDALAPVDPGYDPANLAAGLMLSPRSAEEVSRILALCQAMAIPVVPQGGRTGLVAGGVTSPGEIILSTRRLDRIVEIDPVGRTALVEAGVTLEALQEAAARHGLSPGIDLAARGSATIGGMIATNAGGIEAFRHGTMRDRLLGIEFVLADGTVVSDLGRVLKNNTGYDLKDLVAGSEGTLGVVTRAVLRLDRATRPAATALLALPSIDDALAVANRLRDRFAGRLRALEVMWRDYAAAVAGQHGQALADFGIAEQPLYLLVELDRDEDLDIAEKLALELETLADRGVVADAVIAQNERQRRMLWLIREDSEAIERAWPGAQSFDVSVPLPALGSYADRIARELPALSRGLRVFIFGHLADGNLHVMVGSPEGDLGDHADGIEAILYDGLDAIGGAFSAEHGIGREKLAALVRYGNPAKRAAMRAIKSALDPRGILNPGKMIV